MKSRPSHCKCDALPLSYSPKLFNYPPLVKGGFKMTHIATAIVSTEYDGKPRNLYSKLCSQCNSEFFVPKHRLDAQLCCSRKCASAMKHKKSRVEIACYNCGTKTTRAISDLKNSRHQVFFCSRKCKETSQSLQGNCPKIRPDHYGTGGDLYTYRKTAFEHHPHRCNRCGYDRYIPVLRVHHIDRNRKNGKPENLEILCPRCHEEEHFLAHDGIYGNNNLHL